MFDAAALAFLFCFVWRIVKIKKQLQTERKLLSLKKYEVAFHRYNYLHLTGVKTNTCRIASSIHFYEKCLGNRLSEQDFYFPKDGSAGQKLEILETMMNLKRNVTMIGDFSDRGPKLFAEKAAGNVNVVASPVQKVYAVFSKGYTEGKYTIIEKLDKDLVVKKGIFSEEIEMLLAISLL